MNELDVVRVKETVMAAPWFEDDLIEIKAVGRGRSSPKLIHLPRVLSSTKITEANHFR
jgi:hypothetical protein